MDFYVGIAKCLSEMSDSEIDRIARVTEVQYVTISSKCLNSLSLIHTNLSIELTACGFMRSDIC